MPQNPFEELTKEEKKRAEGARQAVEQNRNESILAAKKCLANPDFQDYLKKYVKAKEAAINFILNYRNADPIKYAVAIKEAVAELKVVEGLGLEVLRDASKKLTGEKD